ncbi:MAG: hypothetical protein AVDCRST_MAG41-3602 [uncultured Corynebacteriales bacterium]|uniref:Uncharacterized protein n=1 Tax=uncultured Mycobacteriales bacterium TaxID=581187 RepID=A0A6J4JL24_9ACTN|nr:MAG: hypothetical protein AVDCRST_MAG41-3602 [uncultured Corynebacteriales bacterium]
MLPALTAPAARLAGRRRARRAERIRRDRLRAELASYRTPAERADLEATFARHTAEEIAQLEAQLR